METAINSKTMWNLDVTHSEIGFKVKHMMITNVSGTFGKFDLQTETNGDDFSTAKLTMTIDSGSVTTGNDQRDGHLKSGDFFDCENHPQITFVSDRVKKLDDDNFELYGNFTIKGISKPAMLEVELGGFGKDPWGNEKAGFSIQGKINRTDWNLNWNATLESGGILVSEIVRLHAEIQLVKA